MKNQTNNVQNKYIPYPYERPGPRKQQQQLYIEPEIKLRPFNYASKPISNIYNVNWHDIQAMALSDNSSQGVTFVETEEGSCVVKGTADMAIDYFIFIMCRIMQIPVPIMRILKWTDQEFKVMVKQIERASLCDEVLNFRVKPRIDMPYLIIMEYIPGISISNMGKIRAKNIFSHQTPDSRDRLIRLGMIFQFDSFLNNPDRFPFLWDNEGNPNNLIAKASVQYPTKSEELFDIYNTQMQFESFYAIDHTMINIDVKSEIAIKNLGKYFSKLQDFLNVVYIDLKRIMEAQVDLIQGQIGGNKINSLDSIKKFIFDYTGYELQEMQCLQILLGISIGVENFCQFGIDRIGMLHHKMFIDLKDDWEGMWNKNLGLINIEVFADIINVYNKFRNVYADVIKWTKEMTLNQFPVKIVEFKKIMGEVNFLIIQYIQEQDEQEKLEKDEILDENEEKEEEKNDQKKIDQNNFKEDEGNLNSLDQQIKNLFQIDLNQIQTQLKEGKDIKIIKMELNIQ